MDVQTLAWWLFWGFKLWMMIESWRRGHSMPWFWIILFLPHWGWVPPLGAVAYFLYAFIGVGGGMSRAGLAFRQIKISAQELDRASGDAQRLDTAAAWSDYAHLLWGRGKHRDAIEAAEKALAKDDDELQARHALGRSLLATGRPEEAREALERVVAVDEQHDYGEALMALAQAHEAQGDTERAESCLARAAVGSSRPDVLFELARLRKLLGRVDEARECWQRIVDEAHLTPDFARARSAPWVRRAERELRALG
ncbi:MAG: tetratricopeptide repeat protein [Acidobacteriota bacterium]